MKHILQILPALLFLSCGTGTSHYEKTIADAVQTRNGARHDLNFKVVGIDKPRSVTVADSIRYLREEFDAKVQKDIEFAEQALTAYEMIAAIGDDAETNGRIAGQKSRIDSLRNARFIIPDRYAAMSEGIVLAHIVRCTYTIDIPAGSGKVTAQETFDFVLSPDGGQCYRKSKVD